MMKISLRKNYKKFADRLRYFWGTMFAQLMNKHQGLKKRTNRNKNQGILIIAIYNIYEKS